MVASLGQESGQTDLKVRLGKWLATIEGEEGVGLPPR